MDHWQYRKVDLSDHRPKEDELDLLDDAGHEGWELVAITTPHIAYLKRAVPPPEPVKKSAAKR